MRFGEAPPLSGRSRNLGRGQRRWAAPAIALLVAAAGLGAGASPAAAAVACPSGVESDFNGDGIRDLVVADPEAPVGSQADAGEITVVYGGGKGSLRINQDSPGIPGAAEQGDQFGYELAVYDENQDGCSDVAVGLPYEDIDIRDTAGNLTGVASDAGMIQIIHGSTAGLGAGDGVTEYWQGEGRPLGGAAEAGDYVGYALAAGETAAGVPFLVAGFPGEAIGTDQDAGGAAYIHGINRAVAAFNQDTTAGGDVPGGTEQDDQFGASVAASPNHFAVGMPGEALGSYTFAGAAAVFSHTLVNGQPKPLFGMGQDQDNVSEYEETGDNFATGLAMAPYRPSGASSTNESLLAVGIPGEDNGGVRDTGAVQIFRITAAGTFTELNWISQMTPEVTGTDEAGDRFGHELAAINTSPSTVSTGSTVRLAIGVPGEDSGSGATDAGAVSIVPMVGAPGASDSWLAPGPDTPIADQEDRYMGQSLAAVPSHLHVGIAYGPVAFRGIEKYTWNTPAGGAPADRLLPGTNGLAANGKALGAKIR
ncbi:VCBS repeat-containing protein [Streptomyces sp. NRRL F-5727]|uniref:VCBS repeat-containing protein n=1 Tax=Streptomyces sp. NRRL F-5727 TaxID=1463871 RepID=UPI001F3F3DD7|nr:VCBS repeat-containing protein [Streptomyces sp. NRRL F-5727]